MKALSAKASQVSIYEGPVENLIDGSYQTYYHSPYETTTNFPVTLEFEFFGDQRIDYINVMHRGTTSAGVFKPGAHWRGQFGTVKIYYKVNASDPYTYLQTYDFGGNGGYQTVILNQGLENVTWIKFEIQDDSDPAHQSYTDGQYVTCGEVEFFNTNRNDVNEWIEKIFTDYSCSEIKKGVTKKDIIQMNAVSPYLATNVAIPLFMGTYDENEKDFRIHSYEAYSDNRINKELVTQYYTAMDNPTGIEVQEGKDILVCVDKIPAGQTVSLAVYGEADEYGPNYGGGGDSERSAMMISSFVPRKVDTISRLLKNDLPEPDTPRMKPLPFNRFFRLAIIRLLLIAFIPQYVPPGSMISCALKGMRIAVLSVVRVRIALIRRSPYGSAVFSPSIC